MAGSYVASEALYLRVKAARREDGSRVRQYELGQKAGVQPSVLSNLIRGSILVDRDDPRVLRIAQVVGLPPGRAFSRRRK